MNATRSVKLHLRLLSGLLLLAVCFHAAARDLYTDIDRLRAGETRCAAVRGLAPLRPQAALERAARDLAQGIPLQQSLREVGYSAALASAFSMTGNAQSYCRELQDAAMTEIGIYEDRRQAWVVMAAPSGQAAPRPAPAVAQSADAAGRRILDLINQARATPRYCGNKQLGAARPVRWNETLAEASRRHSEEMARYNYFSHNGRNGSEPWDRVEQAGYRYRSMGENIAAGQRNPEEAVAGWIKSPDHCANLMNPVFTEMGAAVAVNSRSELGMYWTQEFGTPR
jgi:uncharacterized protein YkwD